MAGSVHLVDQQHNAVDGPRASAFHAWLENAIVVCLAGVALCAPLATKGAVNCFRAAAVLWVIFLCARKRKLLPQPLTVPLLLFLVLTAISSAFSTDPFLSWGRMRTVSLILLAIIAGQAIRSMRQLKLLTALLIGSCLLPVLYTGWQFTAGIGVEATGNRPALASLERFGLAHGEIIRKLRGRKIRSPQDLFAEPLPSGQVELVFWRETPNALQPFRMNVDAKALRAALESPGITLSRAHPPRAQGFFKHYFPFSEILVLVGLLMAGLAVAGVPDTKLRMALILAFLASAVTLALTLTRISLLSLVVGALIVVLTRSGNRLRETLIKSPLSSRAQQNCPSSGSSAKSRDLAFLLMALNPSFLRWISLSGLLLLASVGAYWVQRHRASPGSDPGTEYRLLMWHDSIGMIRTHPILGVGFDSVAGDWQRWNLEAYRRFGLHSHFHSTPVQLAVECGLPALAVWIWLLADYAGFLLRLQRTIPPHDWFARGLLLGALGGLVGFVLTGFLQYNFGDAEAMVVFWFIAGLTFAASRLASEAGQVPATKCLS